MREFFRGRKRKAGVVTLVLACVFMAGWVRGLSHIDSWYFAKNKIGCKVQVGGGRAEFRISQSQFEDAYFQVRSTSIQSIRDKEEEIRKLRERGNYDIASLSQPAPPQVAIPYWSIVLPLTLLSAYLLLSRPRPAKRSESI